MYLLTSEATSWTTRDVPMNDQKILPIKEMYPQRSRDRTCQRVKQIVGQSGMHPY